MPERIEGGADKTARKAPGRPFEPGNRANPAGRPKGSRNKLGEAFISALHADFEEHGPETIARVREEDPTAYVKVCASLLPKELNVTMPEELTDEQARRRAAELVAILAPVLGSEGLARPAGGRGQGEAPKPIH